MTWSFPHPYLENLSLHIGSFTQVIGQDQELKYYIWQLLLWYFEGKKYKEEDLTVFQQVEPVIMVDSTPLKRNCYRLISIADIRDILEQMTYKKGTIAYDYMKKKCQHLDVMEQLDAINARLDAISLHINQELNLEVGSTRYHTDSQCITIEQLLSKHFLPYFNKENQNIAFEFVENESKVLFLLKMLEELLLENTHPVLLLFKNMDDYLTYPSFRKICQYLEKLCENFPYLQVIIFPSNEGYLHVSKEVLPFIHILADRRANLYEFEFMYERFIGHYPSSQYPSEDEFIHCLQKNASYLLSNQLEHVSLSVKDLVAIKILNQLYQYEQPLSYPLEIPNQLEINFLLEVEKVDD